MPIQEEILGLLRSQEQIEEEKITYFPSNYADLIESALLTEFNQQKKKLLELFSNPEQEVEVLQAAFKKLCKQREIENKNSCLSFTALPEGTCNRLYFDIACILFNAEEFKDVLEILMPATQSFLMVQVSDILSSKTSFSYTLEDRVQIQLHRQPLNTFKHYPAELHFFSQIAAGDNVIIDLNEIRHLPLFIHHKLFTLLQGYPTLKEKLYRHNNDFQQLLFDIELLEKNGTPPNQALSRLIHDLTRSGSRYTGLDEAADAATFAFVQFRVYLEKFPASFQNDILALESPSKDYQLKDVFKELEKGGCVETAASQLTVIQEYGPNKAILNSIPNGSREQLQTIKKRYRQPLSITGNDKTKVLPSSLLSFLLNDITIYTPYDYIDLLLNLPPAEYLPFLKHVSINCIPALPDELGEALEMFTQEQQQHFFLAVLDQQEKFGGIKAIIYFSVKNKLTHFFKLISSTLNTTEKHIFYNGFYNGVSLAALAAQSDSLEIFQPIWQSVTKRNKVKRLLDKGENNLLILIMNTLNMELFNIVWSSLSNQMKNNALTPQNTGASPLNIAGLHYNDDFLKLFYLHILEQEETYFNSILPDLLRSSLNHPSVFLSIWERIPPEKKSFFSNLIGPGQHSLFNQAIIAAPREKITEIIDIMLSSLLLEEQLEIITKKNEDGKNSFYYCLQFYRLPIFKKLWNILPPNKKIEILKEKNGNDKNELVSYSLNHSKIFDIFLNDTKGHDIFSIINIFDEIESYAGDPFIFTLFWKRLNNEEKKTALNFSKDGKSLLSLSCFFGKKYIWDTLWSFHSYDGKLSAIKKAYHNDDTLIHYAVYHERILSAILNFLPDEEKFSALTKTNNTGDTPLHILLLKQRTANCFETAWGCLSPQERLAIVKIKNNKNETLLHLAASHLDQGIFKTVWESLSAEEQHLQAGIKSSNGGSLLHYAAQSRATGTFSVLWDFYSSEDKLKALKEENLLNWAQDYLDIHSCLLEMVPSDCRLIVLTKMKEDDSILQWCVRYHPVTILENLLQHLPEEDKLTAILAKCNDGNTLLQLAIIYRNTGVFEFILEYFSANFSTLMREKNNAGNTALHIAANSFPFMFRALFSCLDSSEKLKALCEENKKNIMPLHHIIHNIDPAFFNIIWENLSLQEKHGLGKLAIDHTYGLLAFTTKETHIQIWEMLWDFYSQENGDTPLHVSVRNKDFITFENILINLPPSVFDDVLHKKNHKGETPLHLIKQSSGFLSRLIESLPEDNRIDLLTEIDSFGNTILFIAAKNSDIKDWLSITSCLSPEDFLSIFYCKNITGNSVLHKAAANTNPDILNNLLSVIPAENKLRLITEKNCFGYSPLDTAKKNRNPALFQVFLKHLSADEKKHILQETEENALQLLTFNPVNKKREENIPLTFRI